MIKLTGIIILFLSARLFYENYMDDENSADGSTLLLQEVLKHYDETINFAEGLLSLNYRSIYNFSSLKSISLPDSLTYFDESAIFADDDDMLEFDDYGTDEM